MHLSQFYMVIYNNVDGDENAFKFFIDRMFFLRIQT